MKEKPCFEFLGCVLRYNDGRPDATIDVTIVKDRDKGGYQFIWAGDHNGSFWAEDMDDAMDMGEQYFAIKRTQWKPTS